jgi:hypothetical protein
MSTQNEMAPNPGAGCIPESRVWALAVKPAGGTFEESEHLRTCAECKARVKDAMFALAARREARKLYAAALIRLATLARRLARPAFALPRPVTGFDTGQECDDSFITFDFDDPNLKAAVSREKDGSYLLHVEHRGRKPGDLVLAVIKSPDESRVVWTSFVMLRPLSQHPVGKVRLDEAAVSDGHYQLYLDAIDAPPAEAADLLRTSFASAQEDDPPALPFWQTWARAAREAGVTDAALRQALEEIRDAETIAPGE